MSTSRVPPFPPGGNADFALSSRHNPSTRSRIASGARWEKRARVLAAVVRLLLALLRASGFSLGHDERSVRSQAFSARLHPHKPTLVVRASRPNEIWHIDTSVIKLIDGTKVYLQAVVDNFSRKILAWAVTERFGPSSTCQVLLAAAKHLVDAGRPLLYADSGVENVNGEVNATLLSACLERVLAQVEVGFSNSIVAAFWRSLKHQWLFLNSLDTVARVRALVEFYVTEHNTKMPHPAFCGQTPDEIFFGTGTNVPEKLAVAKSQARVARLAANRATSCEFCLGQQPSLPAQHFLQ
jgi:transposase InsO family protein